MSLKITTTCASQTGADGPSSISLPSMNGRPAESRWERASEYRALNESGLRCVDLGRLNEASSLFQRALHGYEKVLGRKHVSTLDVANNLGLVYVGLGRLTEAHSMLRRALMGYKKKHGWKHPSTLATINNLGLLYEKLDETEHAREMFQQALDGYEALESGSLAALDVANNLGLIYVILGRLDEAEKLLLRAFDGKEKVLGPDETSTLDTANNLGLLYMDWRKYKSAETMLCRALDGREMVLGLGHIATLGTASNLGLLYTEQGRLDMAEKMHRRALDGCKKTIGLDGMRACVSALTIMWGYASFCATSNLTDDARKWYTQVLTGYRDMLGEDHSTCQALLGDIKALDSKSNGTLQDPSSLDRVRTHTFNRLSPSLRGKFGWRRKISWRLALMRRRSRSSRLCRDRKGYARLG